MKILGIDPGIDGGFFLLTDGVPDQWAIMPSMEIANGFRKKKGKLVYDKNGKKIPKYKREIDPIEMVRLLRQFSPDHIFVEEVTARTGQGVTSMFSFGRAFGDVRTSGAWLGCPLTRVRPKEWQKVMFKGMTVPDTKEIAAIVCKKLWPDLDLRKSSRARKSHEGLCDAACIAEWGRRNLAEGLPGLNGVNHIEGKV